MEARLTYQEISNLVKEKAKIKLSFSYVGPRTVHVSYKLLGIDLTAERIKGTDIYLQYSGGIGIRMMLKKGIKIIKNHDIGEFVESIDGNRIILHLSKNDKISAIFDHIVLEDISFDEQHTIAKALIKG